jgi:lysozyme
MDEVVKLVEELAKPFEGLYLKAYHDPVGFPTQGYGRLLSRKKWEPLDKYPDIDQATAKEWLHQDIMKAMRATMRLCPGVETPEQLAALTDFTFNCGAGNLEISTLRRRVNRKDFIGASDEFMRWVYAQGVKLPGLVLRRKAERDLFLHK